MLQPRAKTNRDDELSGALYKMCDDVNMNLGYLQKTINDMMMLETEDKEPPNYTPRPYTPYESDFNSEVRASAR